MQSLVFEKGHEREDYTLSVIIKTCLPGEGGAAIAETVCHRFKDAFSNHNIYAFNHDALLKSLLEVQPVAVLDTFLTGGKKEVDSGLQMLSEVKQ